MGTLLNSLIQQVTQANDCVQTTTLICWPARRQFVIRYQVEMSYRLTAVRWSSYAVACRNTNGSVYAFREQKRERGEKKEKAKSVNLDEFEM